MPKRKPKEMVLVHSTMTGAQTLASLSAKVEKLSQLVAGLYATDTPPASMAPVAPVSPQVVQHIRQVAYKVAAHSGLRADLEGAIAATEQAAANHDVLFILHEMGVETGTWRYVQEQLPRVLQRFEEQLRQQWLLEQAKPPGQGAA